MRIDFVSDVSCPWCVIGLKSLEQALERVGTVRTSFGPPPAVQDAARARIDEWAAARRWPQGTVHGLVTVLRSRGQLREMVASDPFGGKTADADLKLYVTLLATPDAGLLALPCGIPGDFEVVRVTASEIFHEAYRQPSGRYGAGATLIGKPFKNVLWTNRNWNTIVKAAAA